MDNNKQKPVVLADGEENRKITRRVLECLNRYPHLPVNQISYGMLLPNKQGLALATQQGAVITARYICGGHKAEYTFALVYRIQPGNSLDKRLKADELLDSLGDWAATQRPELEGASPLGFRVMERACLAEVYDGGDEDHQIIMKFTYERVDL